MHRGTSFLLADRVLLDAGAATRGLTLDEQCDIEAAFISHSHLDHVRDLALLADNIIGKRTRPLRICCAPATAQALKDHIFNNVIWPDFTLIPNPTDEQKRSVVVIETIEPGMSLAVDEAGVQVRLVPVNHPVPCHAMFVSWRGGSLVYSADTGPTDQLWQELADVTDLTALIHEVSFPNEMRWLADVSGHLTPEMLAEELTGKLGANGRGELPILLYHPKPGYDDQIEREVAALGDRRLRILRPMDEFEL